MEWIYSIGRWFVEHKEQIVTFVTSASFLGFISNVALIVKSIFKINKNTNSTNALNNSLTEHNKMCEDVHVIDERLQRLEERFDEQDGRFEQLFTKLGAMLDVQSIVYSTLKDEQTRITVANILANAKFSENNTRMELKKELQALKESIAEKVENVVEQVNDTTSKAEAIIENKIVKRS